MPNTIKINNEDNVVVVSLRSIKKGEKIQVDGKEIEIKQDVPKGHKISINSIPKGENIIKYGYPIGRASKDIQLGDHVHVHNTLTNLEGKLEYSYNPQLKKPSSKKEGTFMGYVREDGSVGIRNEIWIVNTVFCVNSTAKLLEKEANKLFEGKTDGVFAFTHPYGCSQMGEDMITTQKVLSDLVNHPNASGVLVLGLGCEDNTMEQFKEYIGSYDENRVKFLVTQESEDEIEDGLKLIEELVNHASRYKRKEVPLSKLVVGLKCGGSDGFSGLTGNPLLGAFSDKLIQHGGTTILTEVPELFGAETILMNRCINEEVFNQTVALINDFKDYFIKNDQIIYDNPSPGNKDGGITTLEDKSLGCAQKGGTENVVGVLDYAQRVEPKGGLNLLKSPGNDGVSTTALVASGSHLVLFTTGRGTPFGTPVPTIKISTNSDLYKKKKNWIDFNAGGLVEGRTMEEVNNEFFEYVVKVASGEKTKNEDNNYKEIVIFKNGVTV